MEFKTRQTNYRQIIDYAFGCILGGGWTPGAKVPSVRELAVELAVNSHTILKAYDHLQDNGIIVPRRGMGFFLAEDARERVDVERRREFFDSELHEVFARMDMLGIGIDEIVEAYKTRH